MKHTRIRHNHLPALATALTFAIPSAQAEARTWSPAGERWR